MSALTTVDAVVAALPGQKITINKASATSEGAGTWHSLWKLAGNPAAGSNPANIGAGGAIPTRTTTGALPIANAASAPLNLLKAVLQGTVAGSVILYDRLYAVSGFAGNVTTLQSITAPPTINRPDGNGADVELWGEVYTAMGATGTVMTATYTDQAGNTGQAATYTQPANALSVGQMVPFKLAADDTGVRALASLQLSISTGTAGDFGLTLLRRIAEIPLTLANVPTLLDLFGLGKPLIDVDACLALMVQCTSTTTGQILGSLNFGE